MKANVGGIDKILRLTFGVVLVGLTVMDVIGVWGWIGLIPLATGLLSWCPMYPLIGMSTTGSKE